MRIVNVFHAGDGNIHPILLFDERDPRPGRAACSPASGEILDECIACGGSVTGEHGIGVEKIGFMHKLFTPTDLAAMRIVRDAFNPPGRSAREKCSPPPAPAAPNKSNTAHQAAGRRSNSGVRFPLAGLPWLGQ